MFFARADGGFFSFFFYLEFGSANLESHSFLEKREHRILKVRLYISWKSNHPSRWLPPSAPPSFASFPAPQSCFSSPRDVASLFIEPQINKFKATREEQHAAKRACVTLYKQISLGSMTGTFTIADHTTPSLPSNHDFVVTVFFSPAHPFPPILVASFVYTSTADVWHRASMWERKTHIKIWISSMKACEKPC